jgi:hypothetical protein
MQNSSGSELSRRALLIAGAASLTALSVDEQAVGRGNSNQRERSVCHVETVSHRQWCAP